MTAMQRPMKLGDLLSSCNATGPNAAGLHATGLHASGPSASVDVRLIDPAHAGRQISDIVEDSRRVTNGALFIARPGTAVDGRAFVDDALRRGAAAVLSDGSVKLPADVPHLIAGDVVDAAGRLAERFFGDPAAKLTLIGVTGTNGKTTTAWLIRQLLTEAGRRCGMIGTITTDDGCQTQPASLTTPPAIEISRTLARMVANGCDSCVMEVSSHALAQRRTDALHFNAAVFTNLSGDHMDYHQTTDAYAGAKKRLFDRLTADAVAVVNGDDSYATLMASECCAEVVACHTDAAEDLQNQTTQPAAQRSDPSCSAIIHYCSISHTTVEMVGRWGAFTIDLPLAGFHNVTNALQATAAAHALGVTADQLQEALQHVTPPPGRLEPVTGVEHRFTVLVDYAHTDAALENVLRTLRPLVPQRGRLVVVFGCGGDRDASKRPRMATVACRFADRVVITSDNPRTEDPQAIIAAIRHGVPTDFAGEVTCEADRAAAIELAISDARPDDVILIAGKGHEDYQIVGTTRRPFDDRQVARDLLQKLSAVEPVA